MHRIISIYSMLALTIGAFTQENQIIFQVTDTQQEVCYDLSGNIIVCPDDSEAYFGQDAQYSGKQPSYTDHGDGTISDNQTGLLWEKSYKAVQTKFADAFDYCESLSTGGYTDWRLPTIKELFSIADFRGELVLPPGISTPYIDQDYFDFEYPTMFFAGQFWSSTKYVKGPIQDSEIEGAFGFNFSDGHIKAYETGYYWNGNTGVMAPGNFVRCVRGEEQVYGVNQFVDNQDETISDIATNLMWQKNDDGVTRDWEEALSYCESLELAGYNDWRLPDVKELQSMVDYDKTDWPAIDDIFTLSDWDAYFWTSTTHGDNKQYACYIAFGKAYSMDDVNATVYYDWHGAGAMRSDPKFGNPADYDLSSANATDLVKIDNYARCVRDISRLTAIEASMNEILSIYPNPSKQDVNIFMAGIRPMDKFILKVFNQSGQLVYQDMIEQENTSLQASDFGPSGAYFLEISDHQGQRRAGQKVILY
jgi:hypothetical protein